jgi:SAM-dependent methyltransferase
MKIESLIYQQKPIYHQPIVGYFYKKRLDHLFKVANLTPKTSCLDIGFESGVFLYKLTQQVNAEYLTGIELNPIAAEKTKKLFAEHPLTEPITLLEGDILTYDFQGQSFDVIFATSVLEHIATLEQIGPRIAQILKPNGRFVVLSPNEHWGYELLRKIFGYTKPVDHYHRADAITHMLQRSLTRLQTNYYPKLARLYKIDVFTQNIIEKPNAKEVI